VDAGLLVEDVLKNAQSVAVATVGVVEHRVYHGQVKLVLAQRLKCVFAPSAEEIYPPGAQTCVDVTEISRDYEGASRPGHFRGVATVVLKLFQIVQPSVAAFGQKDAQQAVVIRRMVRDLLLDVEVLVLPIVRDPDGLALSSRNRYLSADERETALALPQALDAARGAVTGGQRSAEKILAAAREVLEPRQGLVLDYLELVDGERFEPVKSLQVESFLIVAARVGQTRLLDNLVLHP